MASPTCYLLVIESYAYASSLGKSSGECAWRETRKLQMNGFGK